MNEKIVAKTGRRKITVFMIQCKGGESRSKVREKKTELTLVASGNPRRIASLPDT